MDQGYQSAPGSGKNGTTVSSALAERQRGSRYQPVFPAAIAAIWKHPTPAMLEVAWRWLGSLPLLLFGLHLWTLRGDQLTALAMPLSALTVFKPVESAQTLGTALAAMTAVLRPYLLPGLPICLLVWLAAAAAGRAAVLRLLSGRIQAAASAAKPAASAPLAYKPLALLPMTVLRAVLLGSLYLVWTAVTLAVGRATVTDPAARNGEPHIVLFAALAVGAALLLFALWCAISWPLGIAQVLALRPGTGSGDGWREAVRLPRRLRNELIEVNLVMGIVRLGLLILWLVLSACPLPFSSVETTQFLVIWNAGAIVLWLLASDLFHTVRQAIVIRLLRTWSNLLDA